MSKWPEIDTLLPQLDRWYQDLPASETEEASQYIKTQLAQRRWLQVQTPSRARWLAYAMMGSTLIFLGWLLFLIWKFSPVFYVNQETGQFRVLGGLIEINPGAGKMKVGDNVSFGDNQFKSEFIGQKESSSIQRIDLSWNEGRMKWKTSADDQFRWNCKIQTDPTEDLIKIDDHTKVMKLDFAKLQSGSCEFEIPSGIELSIQGEMGSVYLNKLENNIDLNLQQAEIFINADDISVKYQWSLGDDVSAESFDSTLNAKYLYKIKLTKGQVGHGN